MEAKNLPQTFYNSLECSLRSLLSPCQWSLSGSPPRLVVVCPTPYAYQRLSQQVRALTDSLLSLFGAGEVDIRFTSPAYPTDRPLRCPSMDELQRLLERAQRRV